jgi:hypothetical protein
LPPYWQSRGGDSFLDRRCKSSRSLGAPSDSATGRTQPSSRTASERNKVTVPRKFPIEYSPELDEAINTEIRLNDKQRS